MTPPNSPVRESTKKKVTPQWDKAAKDKREAKQTRKERDVDLKVKRQLKFGE
jgi:hypothetical protein